MTNKCNICGKEVGYWGSNQVGDQLYCNDCYSAKFSGTSALGESHEDLLKRAEINKILVSSLLKLENKTVVKYFDIITAEVVLGTGMFSEFGAATADFFGTRSGAFENKLKQAKEYAINELKKKSYDLGAAAVLGSDIDYMEIGKNMFMVTISGTPVVLEDKE